VPWSVILLLTLVVVLSMPGLHRGIARGAGSLERTWALVSEGSRSRTRLKQLLVLHGSSFRAFELWSNVGLLGEHQYPTLFGDFRCLFGCMSITLPGVKSP
jgi:hypothetical protein